MSNVTMMPFREAYGRFALAERLGPPADSFDSWGSDSPLVEFHAGDHVLDGSLRPYARDHGVCGLIVEGTLEVKGSILDESSDDNTFFLLVGGDLVVEHLVAGGLCAAIGGDLLARGDAVFWDGHGQLKLDGSLEAQRVVILSGVPQVAGGVRGDVLNLGGWPDLPWPSSRPALREVLTPEAAAVMLDGEGEIASADRDPDYEIARAYFEGRRVFREI
jgi:hypothetical protein